MIIIARDQHGRWSSMRLTFAGIFNVFKAQARKAAAPMVVRESGMQMSTWVVRKKPPLISGLAVKSW